MGEDTPAELLEGFVMTRPEPTTHVEVTAAASMLSLDPSTLEDLVHAGFLRGRRTCMGDLLIRRAEVEAFASRNRSADRSVVDLTTGFQATATAPAPAVDLSPEELFGLLAQRVEPMALRMLRMFSVVFPEAEDWPVERQQRFVNRTRRRFEAILGVAAAGSGPTDSLYRDLEHIGAAAAHTDAALPQLLVVLRMSRDLVVQNAVDIVEHEGRHGGFALSLLLTRVLPAMDRLGDALAAGYWEATLPS